MPQLYILLLALAISPIVALNVSDTKSARDQKGIFSKKIM
jgi:hypothetical protein